MLDTYQINKVLVKVSIYFCLSFSPVVLSGEFVEVVQGTLPSTSSFSGTTVAKFFIGKHEITWSEWKAVRNYANLNGYDLANIGIGSDDNHPVRDICWYDALKWCNAKSEMDNLSPAYFVSGNVYRSGEFGHADYAYNAINIDSTANGYRLPTEVEWEWAARGGVLSQGFTYSGSNEVSVVAWYQYNSSPASPPILFSYGTHPVGQKQPNELGIFDMSGNVWELCWDYDDDDSTRVSRGGSWMNSASDSSINGYDPSHPDFRSPNCGMRLATSVKPPTPPASSGGGAPPPSGSDSQATAKSKKGGGKPSANKFRSSISKKSNSGSASKASSGSTKPSAKKSSGGSSKKSSASKSSGGKKAKKK